MTESRIERIREGRLRPSVLKVKLSQIRSKDPKRLVFVFEGPEDVGPYQVWISRCNDSLTYEIIVAKGKNQVLEFRESLKNDLTGLNQCLGFFIDRDFDDLAGSQPGADLFCTDAYSIENYLITERVLGGILDDELRCAGDVPTKEALVATYRTALEQFCDCMTAPNFRIFVSRKNAIRITNKEERIQKYVAISIESVKQIWSALTLPSLIVLEREPSQAESQTAETDFGSVKPLEMRHRGKYIHAFFLKWVELLSVERQRQGSKYFSQPISIAFSINHITLRSLASRSDVPPGLREFLGNYS